MIDDKIKDISDKITKKASGGNKEETETEEEDTGQPQEPDATSALKQKLKETKGEVKLKKSQIPDLINYLDTEKDEQKVNASRALVEVAQHYPDELEKHIESILDLLDEENSMVQKHACIALGVIGSEKALPNLNKTKETAEPEVANAAEKAMRYIKKQQQKIREGEDAEEEEEKEKPEDEVEEAVEPEIEAAEPDIEEEPRLEGVTDEQSETEEPDIEAEEKPILEEEEVEEVAAEGLDDPVGMSEEEPEEEIIEEDEPKEEPEIEEKIETEPESEKEAEPEIETDEQTETEKTPEPEMSAETNFLTRANDGLSNARYELPTLVLLWGLLKSGDSTRESIENAAQEVIREYPEAVKSATPDLIEILNEGDQDLAEFATIMVDEIVIEYPEQLESQIPQLLDSLERGDDRVKEQATNALTKLAQRSPDKVVEEFVERTNK